MTAHRLDAIGAVLWHLPLKYLRYVTPGQRHNLVVHVRDDVRSGSQPGGKQCPRYKSYARVPTPVRPGYGRRCGWKQSLRWVCRDVVIVPDLDGSRFIITPTYYALAAGQRLRVSLIDNG